MKKIYSLLSSLLVIGTGFTTAHAQLKTKEVPAAAYSANYTSFSKAGIAKSAEVIAANKGYEQDPELGMQYADAPCKDCYELIGERTETSKTYAKAGSFGKQVIVRSSNFPQHFRDVKGKWRTIHNYLQPAAAGVYTTGTQPIAMKIDAAKGFSNITTEDGSTMTYNRLLELIYVKPDGSEQSLGLADWSHYTAGDNGMVVTNAWPGVDIEMTIRPNGIKTNFSLNQPLPAYSDGKLLLRDHMELGNGLRLSAPQQKGYTGNISVTDTKGADAFRISTAVAYEKHDAKHTVQNLSYSLPGDNILDLTIPGNLLNKAAVYYPLIIDPLVVSNSITGPNFSRYTAYCTATNNVPMPAGVTITDMLVGYAYAGTAAGIDLANAGFNFRLFGCTSPNPALYYGYGCTGSTASFYCGISAYSVFAELGSCMPAMSCTAYSLPVVLGCTQTVGSSGGACSNFYFYSYLPFVVDVYGNTVPVPAVITGTPSVCIGATTTLANTTPGGVWSSSAGAVATVDPATGVVTGLTAGTSTISYSLSGCNATVVVTVNTVAVITGPSAVCSGSAITLANATTGGTWSSSSTATATVGLSTGIVTGVAAGTVTITYTSTTGCKATKIVTVNALPSAIAGTLSVCIGSTTTLTDATAGGTWLSITTAVGNIDVSSGVLTGVSAGNTVISYVSGTTGCAATAIATVNALPVAITGVASVCVGFTTSLSDATPGGTWTSVGPSAAIGSGGLVTGVTPGTSTISYTLSTGCASTVIVTVNPLPGPITGTLTVCTGYTTTLGNSAPGGTWNSGSTLIAGVGAGTGIVSGVSAGTSIITYTIGTGCSVTAVVTVYASPAAIAGTLGICAGTSSSLTDATTGGTWTSSSAVATVGAASGVVNGVSAGNATITYTVSNGCTATAIVTVYALPTAIAGVANVCVNSVTTLGDAVTGGTWTSGNTAVATIGISTGYVTGVTAGTSIITYTVGSGCTATIVVTVNPLPAPITGVFVVCEGAVTTVSTTSTGGTWISGSTAFATVDPATGVVTGVAAGNSTISYQFTATGCVSTAIVTVKPLPAAITGLSTVCIGSTTPYTDVTGGGGWASGTTSVATVDATTGVVTGVSAGTSIISYILPTGCFVTKIITVNALPPAIGGTLAICEGATTTLTNGSAGGTWTSGTTSVATIGAASGVVTAIASGTTIITYRATTGCSVTAIVTVNPGAGAITGTLSVCVGLTTTLSNTSAGVWSSGTTAVATIGAATGIVTGVLAGTSVITFTTASGCIRTAVVTVNALPAAIGGTLSVCTGLTTTLSNTSTGGTWTSSNSGIASVGASSGVVTGVSTTGGTATITYTLSTGCLITAIVTVNPLPAPITGTLAVCVGLTTTLATTSTGGTWTSGTTAVATIGASSGIATGIAGGNANITYTLPTGCIATAVLTVNPLPSAITGTASVCVGLTTSLSSTTGSGTWTSGTTSVATIDPVTGVVTGVAAGTSIITYSVGTGCLVTRIVTVNALPASITGTATVCEGLTTTLSDTSPLGAWTSGTTSIAIVTAAGGVVTGIAAGTATITYTLLTGCIATRVVTVNAVPPAITGTLSLCIGLTTTLANTSAPGTWTSNNTAVATVGASSGVVTGITAGTARITFSIGTGCYSTVIVTVNPLPTVIGGTPVVCVGSVTTLTNGTGSGTWTSSNTAVATVGLLNGAVTGISSGTSVITYTLGSGCIVTATITVNPIPAVITGPSGICFGATVTLGNTTAGGTWSSSNSGIASVGASTGYVTGVSLGTATISYSLSTGCNTRLQVTVNPLPAAIAGPSQVCAAGGTITLSDASTGGTWVSSNIPVATVGLSTGIVTGVTAGTTNIIYTLPTGCSASTIITVNPVPASVITPIGDTTFCPGGFVALTANTGAGLSYLWYVGAGAIPGTVSSTYVATTSGSYQVRVTNGFGCATFSTPMLVTVDAPLATITAAGGTSTTCTGAPITLNANTGTGLSYQWLLDGAAIPGAVGSSYAASTSGDYSVVVSNTTGCSATSSVITVTVNPAPAATVTLSGPLTFCQNDSVVLSAPLGTGYSYQWNTTAGGAIAGATGRSYTATVAGSYSVDVTNSFGCTTGSAVSVVVVNPLPNVGIVPGGSTIFCTGGSVTLNATSGGGLTYQWFKNGTAIAGATNAVYIAVASGGYRVQVTNTATGCTDKTHADTVVTLVATPVILPLTPTAFCWGGSALLATSVSGATGTVLYQWYKDGLLISGATGSTYNATTSGSYKCDIVIVGSCTVSTVSTIVTENPLPNPVVTFDGTLFHTAGYYITYQWYKNLVMIPGAVTAATPATGNGNYKVAVTDSNGCQSFSAEYILNGWTGGGGTGGSTGVTTVNDNGISIYPNPAQLALHIVCKHDVRTSISGVDGRTVIDLTSGKDIDISSLADGIYLVRVYDLDGRVLKTEKLVKAEK